MPSARSRPCREYVQPVSLSSWVYSFPEGLTIVPDLLSAARAASREITELRFQRVQRPGRHSLVCAAVQTSHKGSPWAPALHAACLNNRLAIKRTEALAALTGQPAQCVTLPEPDPDHVVERRLLELRRSLYFGHTRITTDIPELDPVGFIAEEIHVICVADGERGGIVAIRGLARDRADPTGVLHLVYDSGDLRGGAGQALCQPDDVLDHLRRTA
jgi:hypothetical protein